MQPIDRFLKYSQDRNPIEIPKIGDNTVLANSFFNLDNILYSIRCYYFSTLDILFEIFIDKFVIIKKNNYLSNTHQTLNPVPSYMTIKKIFFATKVAEEFKLKC